MSHDLDAAARALLNSIYGFRAHGCMGELYDEYLKEIVAFALAQRRQAFEKSKAFFDVLESDDNPLTATQLIFHFQDWCAEQAREEG